MTEPSSAWPFCCYSETGTTEAFVETLVIIFTPHCQQSGWFESGSDLFYSLTAI